MKLSPNLKHTLSPNLEHILSPNLEHYFIPNLKHHLFFLTYFYFIVIQLFTKK